MDSSSHAETLAIVACVLAALALLAAVAVLLAVRRLRSAQRILLDGEPQDLVSHAADLQREFEALHGYVGDVAGRLDGRVALAEERLGATLARRGLVRYDAYLELSGRQSFSLALLDESMSGIVLSSIHHRDQARTYTKYIVGGQGDVPLTTEEEQAIALAMDGDPPPLPEPIE